MILVVEYGNEDMKKLFQFRNDIVQAAPDYQELQQINAESKYVKYTSISTIYPMLESDALYLFCSELSNDKAENGFLFPDQKTDDTYITCFYQDTGDTNCNDVYSQWMSYCKDGGVSIDFYFGQALINCKPNTDSDQYSIDLEKNLTNAMSHIPKLFDYSILYADYDKSSKYIKMSTYPFQVQYFDNEFFDSSMRRATSSYLSKIDCILEKCKLTYRKVAPYFKHSGFVQEHEARLAFTDENNRLSKCIRFLNKKDGTKIPYIVIKFGDVDDIRRPCEFVKYTDVSEIDEAVREKISKIKIWHLNDKYPIIIPQGNDQEAVFNAVDKVIKEYVNDKKISSAPPIICQGHLPITKITVAPTNDRAEQRKMLEIYCKKIGRAHV